MEHRSLVIIGGGPAGLTAAIYAMRSGLDVLLVEKGAPGGQINSTSDVENWPGLKQVSGFDLAQSLQHHAEHVGAEIRTAELTAVDFSGKRKILATDKGSISSDAVILCTGARHRPLGVPGEAALTGRGVSYCAVCDGPFFRNEDVVVVGGGNSAAEEAEFLTRFASRVFMVHRRNKLRAADMLARRVLANPKIEMVWDSVVASINGKTGVQSVSVRNCITGEARTLAATGVFIFVGTDPNSGMFRGSALEMSPEGWIQVDDRDLKTSVPGVFAAGDVRETSLRQVVTAAGDGARAAMSAYAYLAGLQDGM